VRGFISRTRLARLLDRKPGTLAMWDRKGRGVGGRGRIFVNDRAVVYAMEDAEKFMASLGLPVSFVAPQERLAARGGDVPRPEQGEAGTPHPPEARSGHTQEPAASTTDESGSERKP
jgi:hypothetical protein